ncbi:MAG: sigma-70 family RNA polymerase sigma factor [Bacteroidota bacterium]
MTVSSSPPMPLCDVPTFWDSYQERIYAFILKRVSDRDLAADLHQEVLLKVYEFCLKDSGISNPASWLYQIASNAIADHFRKLKKEEKLLAKYPDFTESEEEGLHMEAAACIRPLLRGLPTSYALPLQWADLDGLSQQVVADRLELSLSGAKSRIQRAREKLKTLILECCHVSINQQGQLLEFTPRNDCTLFQCK